MLEDMAMRGLRQETQRNYLRSVRNFAAFLKRPPDTATADDIRRFVAPVTRKLREGLTPENQPAPTSLDATRVQTAEAPLSARRAPGRRYRMTAALATACVLVVGAVIALAWSGGWIGAGKVPPRLSIAVLPFQDMDDDPTNDYLADAVTDDLTTDLSRIPGAWVIARESAYTYKGKATDVRQIGRELGVRYVLEGSVRQIGRSCGSMFSSSPPRPARICGRTGSMKRLANWLPGNRRSSHG
jgi:hypothetical protein